MAPSGRSAGRTHLGNPAALVNYSRVAKSLSQNRIEESGWPGSTGTDAKRWSASPRSAAVEGGLRPTASHPERGFWDDLQSKLW
jgi:hypothetical protein